MADVSDRRQTFEYDAIVVGAGPAGSCAATTALARAGRSVLLLERGPFAGSKNMYGGVVYPLILDGLHPEWEEAPIERWVTRRSTMVLTATQAFTIDFRTEAWAQPPYNGATAFRPDFDHWLAAKAEADGADLVTSTTVVGLLRQPDGTVARRCSDRPPGRRHPGPCRHRA